MVEPIRPEEVVDKRFPDGVILSFNQLIQENMKDGTAHIKQDDIINRILTNMSPTYPLGDLYKCRQDIFQHNWLDVGDTYRKVGWIVYYDNGEWNEDGVAFFEFKKLGTK